MHTGVSSVRARSNPSVNTMIISRSSSLHDRDQVRASGPLLGPSPA